MVLSKKVKRIRNNIIDIGVDFTVNNLLNNYHIPFGIAIQEVMNHSPYDIALSILAVKLGIQSKLVLSIIIAFLL
jgi:hypothetical protein